MIRKVLTCCALIMCTLSATAQSNQDAVKELQKLNQFYRYLSSSYVDDVDMKPLVESAIKEMLSELDPHSQYLTAEEMKSVNESFDGEFSGIGVEFNILRDTVIVVNTVISGPAQSVGLVANDRIISVDGESIIGLDMTDVPKKLRGKRGSKVNIEVIRSGIEEPLDFTITRDNIPINTIDAAYHITPESGYIKVNRFGRTTMDEFSKAYDQLQPINSLVLDLRGNGGGLLDQAIEMSEFFLKRGEIIVSTEGRATSPMSAVARRDGEFTSGNLIVLIDENSASASEIVSGAIQDWDRGVIMGQPSFGKGLVQRQYILSDGSAARITVARYHTPTGRVIQRPYTKGDAKEYYQHHTDRLLNKSDSLEADSHSNKEVFYTLRKGRKVYGGGGITPDIIAPKDTTAIGEYYSKLIRQGVITEYIITLLDNNRVKMMEQYPTFKIFDAQFTVTPEMIAELRKTASARGIEATDEEIAKIVSTAELNIKSLIAQRLFTTSEYFRVVNSQNKELFPLVLKQLQEWE